MAGAKKEEAEAEKGGGCKEKTPEGGVSTAASFTQTCTQTRKKLFPRKSAQFNQA